VSFQQIHWRLGFLNPKNGIEHQKIEFSRRDGGTCNMGAASIMGLSYHFTIAAAGDKRAAELESFLRTVELSAKTMGFAPTMVLDAAFDSQERRLLARRLTRGHVLEDESLKNVALKEDQVWQHDPIAGYCRLIPERGVVLVVTDEGKCESVFGFFRYPTTLIKSSGEEILKTLMPTKWIFSDFVDSPDPRYRAIIRLFAEAGYVESEKDEFSGCRLPPSPDDPKARS